MIQNNEHLPDFGLFLKLKRLESRSGSQKDVQEILKVKGISISQSILAKYENGSVQDPDPKILRLLAETYKISYEEMIEHLVVEKYQVSLKTKETEKS